MAAVKRVLRDDGVLVVEIGDSYGAGSRKTDKPQDCKTGMPGVGRWIQESRDLRRRASAFQSGLRWRWPPTAGAGATR